MHGIMYPKELGGTFYINPTFIYSNDRTCGYSLVVNEVEGEPLVSCSNPGGEAKRHKVISFPLLKFCWIEILGCCYNKNKCPMN